MKAPFDEEFMQHHLASESYFPKFASTNKICRRQILEHLYIDAMNRKHMCDPRLSSFYQSITFRSWMQRIFLENVEQMDKDFLRGGKTYDQARERLCDKYLFEIYQLKEFLQSGGNKLHEKVNSPFLYTISLSYVTMTSDASIYPILKSLKKKYPQVADNNANNFPQVNEIKKDSNLLLNFPSKYLSDLHFYNSSTQLHDLKFLFDTAFDQFNDFKSDMQDLLGEDVLADVKVKCTDREEGRVYNASSTRRVLIKWVEVLL